MSRATTKPIKKNEAHRMGSPNPYVMAIFTAILAGIFSVIGGYFTAEFQAKQAINRKQLEYRVMAYSAFLDKTDRAKVPNVSQILNIGSMADHLAIDGEIQAFEDRIADFLAKYNAQEIYWQLNADFNTLRLHGSCRVDEICNDILMALLLRDEEINWSIYPSEVIAFHDRWKVAQEEGTPYGWEEWVTGGERLMVVTISKLTQILIEQLRAEIHAPST